jgi:hypothetical protein
MNMQKRATRGWFKRDLPEGRKTNTVAVKFFGVRLALVRAKH